jgi:putative ABC transport system substrate-binding protein
MSRLGHREVPMSRLAVALLSLALLAGPLVARAQQTGRVYRIGMLQNVPAALNASNLDAFRQGLRELGYVEGQNVLIEYRSADGRDERFPNLATELVRLQVDLIVTRGTPAALAVKNATGTIPVVTAGIGDPVGQGIVLSLARPGHRAEWPQHGNIWETGRADQRAASRSGPSRRHLQHE